MGQISSVKISFWPKLTVVIYSAKT